MSELLKQMGFTTPFIYAAGVYGFFHYLEKKASEQAKTAISGWLQPRGYDKAAVADAMVEIFDRLYTRPLLGWRAFMRSALFTICMTAVFFYEFGLLSTGNDGNTGLMTLMTGVRQLWAWPILALGVLANVACDYIALFIIRPFLILGKRRPMLASLFAPIAGISIVLAAYYGLSKVVIFAVVQDFVTQSLKTGICEDLIVTGSLKPEGPCADFIVEVASAGALYGRLQRVLRLAAFVVHLWLPLLALSVTFLKSLNYFRLSVGAAQWFLKKGREHPLDAIGSVAAILVFVATAVIQHMDVIAVVLRPVAVWKMP
jgi:hypothetical protein